MKPIPQPPSRILTLGACLLAAPALTAGTVVNPSNVVSGDTPVGTLLAVDTPYQGASPSFSIPGPLGPDWPEDTDDGWEMKAGSNLEADHAQSNWEPDGTPIAEARVYRLNSAPGSSYTFDLPDGAVVFGVYATWATRGTSGSNWGYSEVSSGNNSIVQNNAPSADMVLKWTDAVATERNGNFQKIFTGPIVVTGGDGFTVTSVRTGNTHQSDAVVVDYLIPGAYWDTDGTTAGSGGATPSGTWDAATTNWDLTASDGTGAAAAWSPGATAAFSAGSDATGSYTVTVDGTLDIGGLFFEDGDPTLAAGTSPALQIDSDTLLTVLDGNTATIAAPFTETGGSWALKKLGAGSLVLSGDNSGATGGAVLEGGITQFDAPNSIPGTGENLTLNEGGILRFGSSFVDTNIPAALDRIVPASSGLIVADNYASTNFDLDTPGLASAFFGAIGNVNYTGTLTPNSAGYRLGGGGGTLTLPAALSPGLPLTTKAPGVTQLNGFSSSVGSLSGNGDIENGSGSTAVTLTVNQSTNATFSGSINDGGAASTKLVKSGSSELALRGTSDFTGGVEIAGSGRINVTNAGNEQSLLGDASNVVTFTADGELYNANGAVTLPQGITINGGVTGRVTGAFGERTEVDGVLAGSGTLVVLGYSAGYNAEFRNTGNTFTGPIEIRSGDSVEAEFRSLVDSPGATTIGLQSNGNLGGRFTYMSGATAPLVLNNRQFELIVDGGSGTNSGRQAKIYNNASGANTVTINQDLLITGTGSKKLYLGGGNTGDNTFAGDIPDGVAAAPFTLYKESNGKWILSGANTYTGGTVMSGGTLSVNGSLADSSMTVSNGTVDGSGTLTFGPTDQIDISGGTVDLSGFTIEGSGLTDPVYIIVDSVDGGAYTNTFATVNVPGYTVNYDYDGFGTQVALEQAGGSPFDTWAGTGTLGPVTFGGDTNGDGVQDGMAFLLGVANPDDDANGNLPAVSEDGSGNLVMTFECLAIADRGTATLNVQHSGDLAAWAPLPNGVLVPDASGGPTDGVTFVVGDGSDGPGGLNGVTATIDSSLASGGKLFGRLNGTE